MTSSIQTSQKLLLNMFMIAFMPAIKCFNRLLILVIFLQLHYIEEDARQSESCRCKLYLKLAEAQEGSMDLHMKYSRQKD